MWQRHWELYGQARRRRWNSRLLEDWKVSIWGRFGKGNRRHRVKQVRKNTPHLISSTHRRMPYYLRDEYWLPETCGRRGHWAQVKLIGEYSTSIR